MPEPYIHFQGNCAEAMTFYADIFGGTDLQISRYGEAPNAPPEHKGSDLVMHSQVMLEGGHLMASDYPPGMDGLPQQSVSITVSPSSVERGETLFNALGKGGAVVAPYGVQFFSPGFGMVKDRFGTHWMIMVQNPTN